jgi:hypothetical protein
VGSPAFMGGGLVGAPHVYGEDRGSPRIHAGELGFKAERHHGGIALRLQPWVFGFLLPLFLPRL